MWNELYKVFVWAGLDFTNDQESISVHELREMIQHVWKKAQTFRQRINLLHWLNEWRELSSEQSDAKNRFYFYKAARKVLNDLIDTNY